MIPAALEKTLAPLSGPIRIAAQAGNVSTGAFDPFSEIAALPRAKGAWLHVDGAFALWAALRSLGRSGVGEMVSRCCDLARRMADRLRAGGVPVLNDVVLNQVLVRFTPSGGGDADGFTKAVVGRIQRSGVTWASGTKRHDRDALRISVSNWSTTEADIDRSAEAILAAVREEDRL